jgi:hypothetical protein
MRGYKGLARGNKATTPHSNESRAQRKALSQLKFRPTLLITVGAPKLTPRLQEDSPSNLSKFPRAISA